MQWRTPRTVKELQSFLGLVNYYRDFISRFSFICLPLYKLTRQNTPFVFDAECLKAFDQLKAAVRDEVVLPQPDLERPFFLECDASAHWGQCCIKGTLMVGFVLWDFFHASYKQRR